MATDSPALRVAKIKAEIRGVKGQSGVSSKEEEFLDNVCKFTTLSKPQEKWLSDIEQRVFGDDED